MCTLKGLSLKNFLLIHTEIIEPPKTFSESQSQVMNANVSQWWRKMYGNIKKTIILTYYYVSVAYIWKFGPPNLNIRKDSSPPYLRIFISHKIAISQEGGLLHISLLTEQRFLLKPSVESKTLTDWSIKIQMFCLTKNIADRIKR